MKYPFNEAAFQQGRETATAFIKTAVAIFVAFVVLQLLTGEAHAQEYTAQDYAAMGIDPVTILAVWTWGFGSVVFCWYLGYVAGVALGVIRKA